MYYTELVCIILNLFVLSGAFQGEVHRESLKQDEHREEPWALVAVSY